MCVTAELSTLVIETTLHIHSVVSCVRLIIIQLSINTVHLRNKGKLSCFSGNNSYASFLEIKNITKNLFSLNCQ